MTWEEKTDRDYRGSPARNSDRDSAPGAIDELPNALGYSQLIRMNKRGPVTIRGVAAKVGLSTYTVSLALRGDRRVPAATQARVKATAEAMGYRTNPLVSANMERVRRSRWSKGTGATIGLVYESRADGVLWCTDQDLIAGVRRKAEELGFGCDEFDLGKARYRPGSVLARALGARGIGGVVIAPLRQGGSAGLALPYEKLAVVACGYSVTEPLNLTRVSPDHYNNCGDALAALYAAGYRRVGLVLPATMQQRSNYLWHARYLQFIWARAREMAVLPLLETPVDRRYEPEVFRTWYQANRPEVILTIDEAVERLFSLAEITVPNEVAWAVLDWGTHYFGGRVAGMDQRMGTLGEAAAELVARKLWENQYGLPGLPQTTELRGVWRAGDSAPPLER